MRKHCLYLVALAAAIIGGCGPANEGKDSEALPGGSVTLWTSRSELFMEYPALIVGQEARFAVHLTWLSDFKPVTEGKLVLLFNSGEGGRKESHADKPTSPGIYRPTVTFDRPGEYDLTMIIGGRAQDTLHIEGLRVYTTSAEVPSEEPASPEQLITFLKEQQWKIDFRTEPVFRRPIAGTIRAACEIIPTLNSEVIVSAPFSGIITKEDNPHLPLVGQQINKGARLAAMVPSAETPSGLEDFSTRFSEAETERALTEKELERAKQLRAIDGISEKEYQEAEASFRRAEATYRSLGKYARSNDGELSAHAFTLTAPISGTIINANVVPGRQVNAGEPLYRVIDTRSVWIRADVVSTEITHLTQPRRAWLQLAGAGKLLEINAHNGRLVSIAKAIDPVTRSFPVIFETRNPDGDLRIGLFGELIIATEKEKEALVVPSSALIEDEGRYSVYVHVEGEAFARRDVTLGDSNGQFVEIQDGISEGERVVTTGAYQVRLASLSSQLPAHGHEH